MKRISVVDDSQAVRETVALILGRDFGVVQYPVLSRESLFHSHEEVDLLILGLSPELGPEPAALLGFARQTRSPVLFLVDSNTTLDLGEARGKIDWLAKPFNPYELREKVRRLLAGPELSSILPAPAAEINEPGHYLDFPYLPKSISTLAKKFAASSLPILITAEMGCGQDRVARAMYSLNREAGAWIAAHPPGLTREFLAEQISEASRKEKSEPQRFTLFLSGLDTASPAVQASLLRFLDEAEQSGRQLWVISCSRADLLERVHRGEFLDALYYRLATLTLRLPPLRERRADIPSLAAWLAGEYCRRLRIGKTEFSAAAVDRLCNYLWFGNVSEMETVIAGTLAVHGNNSIDAGDLLLGPAEASESLSPPVSESDSAERRSGDFPYLRILINELAHELKNPMVAIKTFAQLLGERFDDAAFRSRFQETVSTDITRMDELLEALLDFARFSRPTMERIPLHEQLGRVLEELVPECKDRETTIRWGRKEEGAAIVVDGAQFRYALKNVLRAVLAQVKPKGEIQIDVEGEGRVALSYVREGARMRPLARYLDLPMLMEEGESLPLRILLARILLERNGGGIKLDQLGEEKVLIKIETPVS